MDLVVSAVSLPGRIAHLPLMASSRNSAYRYTSDAETASDEALPEDLEAARSIIDNLTRQLKVSAFTDYFNGAVHDDVTANLNILQKRIEHTHKRNQDAIQTLEDRLDEVEATWVKRLESQHNHWIDEYNQLAEKIENAARSHVHKRLAFYSVNSSDGKKLKASKGKLTRLQERSESAEKGIAELKRVATSRRCIERTVGDDKKRIRDIDARLKALTVKERSLNTELTNQLKAQLRNPFTELTDDPSNGAFYGVCEITHSYEETINSLSEALQALEKIGRTSAVISAAKNGKVGETPSVDEIDEITIVMKRFLAKLRVQLASAHFSGSPSRSPPIKTGIERSPPKAKSPAVVEKKKDEKEVTPNSGTSTASPVAPAVPEKPDSLDSSYDSTPLNTPRASNTNISSGKLYVLLNVKCDCCFQNSLCYVALI
ncbi:unnamed protein product [Toxocara canis]|uniref:F-BAR domain-containing protein n=1 Tax=Toxocara canis TaxID=6265 RepID=A0A183URL6_TOXCA|nr:unnamed protein product [Toxocara canis]